MQALQPTSRATPPTLGPAAVLAVPFRGISFFFSLKHEKLNSDPRSESCALAVQSLELAGAKQVLTAQMWL